MILDTHGSYQAIPYGVLPHLGRCYAIVQGETVLHRGSIEYIRVQWRKLTGKKMQN